MSMKYPRSAFLVLLLSLVTLGCAKQSEKTVRVAGDSATTATQVAQVSIRLTHSRDTALTGNDTTSLFGVRDTVHALIRTANASDGSNIYGRWYYLETGQKIAENTAPLLAGTNFSHFDLFDSLPWRQGKYELIVSIDRVVKDSLKFSIMDKR